MEKAPEKKEKNYFAHFLFNKVPISCLNFHQTIQVIAEAVQSKSTGKNINISNVHMLMEAAVDKEFSHILETAYLNTADGVPLVWLGKIAGIKNMQRVAGMDLLPELIQDGEKLGLKIYLYGGTLDVLQAIEKKARLLGSNSIVGLHSPPFGPFTEESIKKDIEQIEVKNANLVFVSLGCPKQEKWMHIASQNSQLVFIGLGGAFPVYAGRTLRAPVWMQKAGLEWLYRLYKEPGRLFYRYFWTNSMFLLLCIWEIPKLIWRRVK